MEGQPLLRKNVELENIAPRQNIGLCNRIFFVWINRVIGLGRKKYLNQNDVYGLRDKDKCQHNYKLFAINWENALKNPQIKSPLQEALWRTYKQKIIWLSVLKLMAQLSQVGQSLATNLLITALTDQQLGSLLLGSGILFFSVLFANNLMSLYLFEYNIYQVQSSSALNVFLAEKTLNYPIIRSPIFKLGDFLNMIQVDISQATAYFQFYILIYVTPVFILFVGYIALNTLQEKFPLIALGSVVQLILGGVLGYVYGNLQRKFMHGKDIRMRYLDEMMGGIKTIKYNSMEPYFAQRIAKKRKYELRRLLWEKLMLLLTQYVNSYLPQFLQLLIVSLYEVSSGQDFFILLTTSGMLGMFIGGLPEMITTLVIGNNSIRRMEPFLTSEDALFNKGKDLDSDNGKINMRSSEEQSQFQDSYDNTASLSPNSAVEIKNGFFEWKEKVSFQSLSDGIQISKQDKKQMENKEIFKLEDINFSVKRGQCVAFVGDIGSGQSSIFYALLGEMNPRDTNSYSDMVRINGKLSVATQEPWIMQGTVRENIIFGQPLDLSLYKYVLRFCGLQEDLRQFPDSDQTFIGEKGETISGGQKKRINLARSLYNESDIYMFDDPLSALDVKVASYVANQGIVGFLSGQTRILFSSSTNHLQKFDRLYYVEKGQIIDIGSYDYINKKYFLRVQDASELKNEESKQEIERSNPILSQKFISLKEPTNIKDLLIQEDKQDGSVDKKIHQSIFIEYGHFYTLLITLIRFTTLVYYVIGNVMSEFQDLDNVINKEKKADKNRVPTPQELQEYRNKFQTYLICQQLGGIAVTIIGVILILVSVKFSFRLHFEIVDQLLGASFPKFYNIIIKGRLMNRLSKDIFNVDSNLPQSITQLTLSIGYFATFFAFFVALGYFELIPLLFLNIGLLIYIVYLFMRSMREMSRIEAISKSPIIAFYTELVRGSIYLRNCISRKYLINRHVSNVQVDLRNQIAIAGLRSWFINYAALISALSIIMCIIVMYFDPRIDPGQITSVVVMLATVNGNIVALATAWINYQVYMINYERCFFLTNNIKQEQESKLNKQGIELQTVGDIQEAKSNNSEILNFKQASLRYRENIAPALTNASFVVQEQEKIGIVGRTGAGKTTITLGLAKMIDISAGQVYFKGKDLNQYNIKELRNYFSVIPQDPFLYQGTLKENLDPNNLFSQSQLEEAINSVQIPKCSSFKNGLQSVISLNGSNLSLGEKQLVSIARAILRKTELILIDEASANMGDDSEKLVINAIEKAFVNCTVLTIAHKIKTIMNSDKIIVVDGGQIAEYDTPDNLRNNPKSIFSSILQAIEKSCGTL